MELKMCMWLKMVKTKIEDHRNQYTYWPISDFETVEEYRDKQIDKLLEDVK
jgi:hypothetical protein